MDRAWATTVIVTEGLKKQLPGAEVYIQIVAPMAAQDGQLGSFLYALALCLAARC
jgi:hypothetical protein